MTSDEIGTWLQRSARNRVYAVGVALATLGALFYAAFSGDKRGWLDDLGQHRVLGLWLLLVLAPPLLVFLGRHVPRRVWRGLGGLAILGTIVMTLAAVQQAEHRRAIEAAYNSPEAQAARQQMEDENFRRAIRSNPILSVPMPTTLPDPTVPLPADPSPTLAALPYESLNSAAQTGLLEQQQQLPAQPEIEPIESSEAAPEPVVEPATDAEETPAQE